jgi:type I restriction enzyme, S subunit
VSFPRYSTYRDSGVEWLGAVPSHWTVEPLKRICDVRPSNIDKKMISGEQAVRLCNYTDVYRQERITADLDLMEATASSEQIERFTLRSGDVIITKDSETADDIAIAAYVPEHLPGVVCGYHLALLRPRQPYCGAFLKRYFDSLTAKRQVAVRANGLTRVGLSQHALDNLVVPTPPAAEQIAIAAFLDHETTKIDMLVNEQRRLIELLKEKRLAVISHAITRGIDPHVLTKDSGIEWLGPVPTHWTICRAKQLFTRAELPIDADAEIVTCFRDGQVTLRRNRREDGFTIAILEVGYQGVLPGQLVLHSMDAFAGAIGVSDSKGKCSPEYLVCETDPALAWPKYFARVLRTMALRGYILAICPSVRERAPRIRFPEFSEILLPLPPLEEQRRIAAHIEVEEQKLLAMQSECERAIALLQERRTALISAAITGKIDVRVVAKGDKQAEAA